MGSTVPGVPAANSLEHMGVSLRWLGWLKRNASLGRGSAGVHEYGVPARRLHLPKCEREDGVAAGAPVVCVRCCHGPLAPAVRQELRHLVPARHGDGGQAFDVGAGAVADGGPDERRTKAGDVGSCSRCRDRPLPLVPLRVRYPGPH